MKVVNGFYHIDLHSREVKQSLVEFTLNTHATNSKDFLYQQLLCARSLELYLNWKMSNSAICSDKMNSRFTYFFLFGIKHRLYLKLAALILDKIGLKFIGINHINLSNLPNFLLNDAKINANIFKKRDYPTEAYTKTLIVGLNLENIDIENLTNIFSRFLKSLGMILELPDFSELRCVQIRPLISGIPSHKQKIIKLLEELIKKKELFNKLQVTIDKRIPVESEEEFWAGVNCVILGVNSGMTDLFMAVSDESKFVFVDALSGLNIPSWPIIAEQLF